MPTTFFFLKYWKPPELVILNEVFIFMGMPFKISNHWNNMRVHEEKAVEICQIKLRNSGLVYFIQVCASRRIKQ